MFWMASPSSFKNLVTLCFSVSMSAGLTYSRTELRQIGQFTVQKTGKVRLAGNVFKVIKELCILNILVSN